MEMRGEVRRGYFVQGLAGAQFAAPAAIEQLRAPSSDDAANAPIVLAASDPSNVYSLPAAREALDHRQRPPRVAGGRSLIVSKGGRILLATDMRATRVQTASGTAAE